MKAMINVGNDIVQETVTQTSIAIDKIFRSAHENHMDQDTVKAALQTLTQVSEIKNITITNSVFKGGNAIRIDADEAEMTRVS